jgi:hypothetical protein
MNCLSCSRKLIQKVQQKEHKIRWSYIHFQIGWCDGSAGVHVTKKHKTSCVFMFSSVLIHKTQRNPNGLTATISSACAVSLWCTLWWAFSTASYVYCISIAQWWIWRTGLTGKGSHMAFTTICSPITGTHWVVLLSALSDRLADALWLVVGIQSANCRLDTGVKVTRTFARWLGSIPWCSTTSFTTGSVYIPLQCIGRMTGKGSNWSLRYAFGEGHIAAFGSL